MNPIRSHSGNPFVQQLRRIAHVALDMDGTIYRGGTLFPFTQPFLAQLRLLGIGYTFLTNNPSKSIPDYLRHLQGMGLPATSDMIYTSAQATIDYLRQHRPEVRRLFVLGTPSMQAEFVGAGYHMTEDRPNDEPDAVVIGFDLTLTYGRLCRAAWWIRIGKPFVATNPDLVCPTDLPTLLLDCGSISAAIEKATGRKPESVSGKPDPQMLRGLLDRHSLEPSQVAMVGDRLYTDMAMARRAGALGVLVLTGEATASEALQVQEDFLVVPTLAEFGAALVSVRQPILSV